MTLFKPEYKDYDGREILLHTGALEPIARLSSEHARLVAGTIARVSFIKTVRHALVDDAATVLGLLPEDEAQDIFGRFKHEFRNAAQTSDRYVDPVTDFFQRVSWTESETSDTGRPVIEDDAHVFDTCSYGPYVDLSTNSSNAVLMFQDGRTPDQLLKEKRQGALPTRLAIVERGAAVTLSDSDLGYVENSAPLSDSMLRAANTVEIMAVGSQATKSLVHAVGETNYLNDSMACLAIDAIGRVISQQLKSPVMLLGS